MTTTSVLDQLLRQFSSRQIRNVAVSKTMVVFYNLYTNSGGNQVAKRFIHPGA